MKRTCLQRILLLLFVLDVTGTLGADLDIMRLRELRNATAKGADLNQSLGRVYSSLAGELGAADMLESNQNERLPRSFTEMDRSIDPNTYVLGANDELTIHIWGSVNEVLTGTVDHEGNLVVPSVGPVKVGGMSLAEAKDAVRKKVLEVYKENDITITLSQIRRFRAYIMGDVKRPGGYTVNGATRVSGLVEMAGGLISIDTTRTRNIEIANESLQARTADLALFYHSNDVSRNPYLTEGDRVFVSRRKEIVTIFGEVTYPGTYDYVAGDRVSTLVEAAGGLKRDADPARVEVTRFGNDKDSLVTFSVGLDRGGDFELQKDDRVMVCRKPDYRVHRNVWVTGEVLYPGKYPITKGVTRVEDAIEMAGGFTPDASLAQSMMFRRTAGEKRDDEVDLLENLPLTSLSPVEKAYVKAKFAVKEGMVSIDFSQLYDRGREAYNFPLRDGDSIAVARRKLTVEVAGAVVVPGHVPYKENAGHRYYIREAGGYSLSS
jgi:protein involved in polysaccharide export with SLBB domain